MFSIKKKDCHMLIACNYIKLIQKAKKSLINKILSKSKKKVIYLSWNKKLYTRKKLKYKQKVFIIVITL